MIFQLGTSPSLAILVVHGRVPFYWSKTTYYHASPSYSRKHTSAPFKLQCNGVGPTKSYYHASILLC
ncbi:hypothetical protein H5410_048811 [Solanum commersonii]|uniref:Uncharacterized protein n=1 Tax=Solanum commersonii TaxID=4109 RepID=A0A9J5XJ82_SOLCO|nr:hypothetical protein H5410_048811 [Solanum commersonii]